MELNDVVNFIKNASNEDRSVIKAALRNPTERSPITDLCKDEFNMLIDVVPHTNDEYKGYRYGTTSVAYIYMVRELANLITHNFICKHNTRGYPVWTGAEDVAKSKADKYKYVCYALIDRIITLMYEFNTTYKHTNATR